MIGEVMKVVGQLIDILSSLLFTVYSISSCRYSILVKSIDNVGRITTLDIDFPMV